MKNSCENTKSNHRTRTKDLDGDGDNKKQVGTDRKSGKTIRRVTL